MWILFWKVVLAKEYCLSDLRGIKTINVSILSRNKTKIKESQGFHLGFKLANVCIIFLFSRMLFSCFDRKLSFSKHFLSSPLLEEVWVMDLVSDGRRNDVNFKIYSRLHLFTAEKHYKTQHPWVETMRPVYRQERICKLSSHHPCFLQTLVPILLIFTKQIYTDNSWTRKSNYETLEVLSWSNDRFLST